ncbi:MAG: hypothetical protein GY754_03595 [bacterium]|nr:hypothetical protein [bacterium]
MIETDYLYHTNLGNCEFYIAEQIPLERYPGLKDQNPDVNREVVSIFLHSANYKFSLGSGASSVVKHIIDGEQESHGFSQLDRQIRKIKKTPVCGVQVTSGGELSYPFSIDSSNEKQYPNFDYIVHAVLPGPRIDDFEQKVVEFVSNCFREVTQLISNNKMLDFCLPIIGVNNFNYPFDFMAELYYKQLRQLTDGGNTHGRIVLWMQKKYLQPFLGHLNI